MLAIAGGALAVVMAVILAIVFVQDWHKKSEFRQFEAKRQKEAARAESQHAESMLPPLPPAIAPEEVARIMALGQAQHPQGDKSHYTWQQIESLMQKLRGERATRPQALNELHSWYNYLTQPAFTGSSDFAEHFAKMSAWRDELPDSPTCLAVLAHIQIHSAWEARGIGVATTVTEEGWEKFRERLAIARPLVREAIERGAPDGHAYELMVVMAKAEGWTPEQTREIVDAGRKVDPTFGPLYSAMAEYLLPRWHGEPGDITKFAAEVVQLVPGDDGLDAYGHIVYVINRYEPEHLFYGGYDRKLLAQAAEVLVRRYPHAPNLVPFAALCTVAAQDHNAARRVMPFVKREQAVEHVPWWSRLQDDYFRWCNAREIPTGESDWIWATHGAFGNIAFDADSRFIWCGQQGLSTPVILLDLQTKEIELQLDGPNGRIHALAFDDQKKWLAATILGQEFKGWVLWNSKNADEPIIHPTDEVARAIAISPASGQLALGFGTSVQTMDVVTGEKGITIELKNHIQNMIYSRDGKRLAVNDTVWDAKTGEM